jgi:ATP-binding cassette subfamily B protein
MSVTPLPVPCCNASAPCWGCCPSCVLIVVAWLALLALTVAAVSTLVLPMAFRVLIDQGFPAATPVTSTSTF